MELAKCTFRQVEDYLKSSDRIIIPIGSTEQHGPTGVFCTDFAIACEVALEAGRRTGVLVSPPISFGMSLHHLAFPGTISLTPSTLMKVVDDVTGSLYRGGFRKFLFVNGHGGNINTLNAAFSEIREKLPDALLALVSWYQLPEVQRKSHEFFGERAGSHSTPGELSVTMHLFPGLLEKAPVLEPDGPRYRQMPSSRRFREIFPDGRMWSDPSLASEEKGKILFELAVESLVGEINSLDS